jgi:hypothetical protein
LLPAEVSGAVVGRLLVIVSRLSMGLANSATTALNAKFVMISLNHVIKSCRNEKTTSWCTIVTFEFLL